MSGKGGSDDYGLRPIFCKPYSWPTLRRFYFARHPDCDFYCKIPARNQLAAEILLLEFCKLYEERKCEIYKEFVWGRTDRVEQYKKEERKYETCNKCDYPACRKEKNQ